MLKVAVVYQILAHYREPVFRLLSQQESIIYTFFSDSTNIIDSVKIVDKEVLSLPVKQGGIRWKRIGNIKLGKRFLWQKGVIKAAFGNEYDILIFLGNVYYLSTWVACVIARLKGKKILMWSHGFLSEEKGILARVRMLFYMLADGLLLYHNRARDILIKKKYDPNKLYVIYNSLDYHAQCELRKNITNTQLSQIKDQIFKYSRDPLILFIGRLSKNKKLDMIVESMKIMLDRGVSSNLLLIGEGPAKYKIQEKAMNCGLSDRVVFYGSAYHEAELAPLISMADVCVAPGNVGLTAMHSLVYGVPVVTHDNFDDQMPEYEAIKNDVNGSFFRQGSVEDLADKIEIWLRKKNKAETAKCCYHVIDRFYNPDCQVAIINRAVQDLFFVRH